jgi:hypothetical protein
MAIDIDGSPKAVNGRMTYGPASRRRRSSKARSSISGGSWDHRTLPLSLRGPSSNTPIRTPTAAAAAATTTTTTTVPNFRQNQKRNLHRPPIQPGSARVLLALNQNSEQLRPFDAFVDVPSPFAKKKHVEKQHVPPAANSKQNVHLNSTKPSGTRARAAETIPLHRTTQTTHPLSSPPPSSPPPYPSPHPPLYPPLRPSPHPSLHPPHNFYHHSVNPIDSSPDGNMEANGVSPTAQGYLDAQTRAANLQHTKPEWTTWDFVDLYLSNLPQGIKTVDIWKNFKKEGEIALIDIFVTRSGQKDNKARLRFRQVLSQLSSPCLTRFQTAT